MSEKDKIQYSKIKHRGFFDFKELYNFLYAILSDWEYNVDEMTYSEKARGADAKEIEINWEAARKVSDYYKFVITADWRILNMKEVEVVRDGKKVKTNNGEVEIKVAGYLVRDYEEKWSGTPFLKFIRGIYDKYIMRKTAEDYEGKIEEETVEFCDQLKAFLVLEGEM